MAVDALERHIHESQCGGIKILFSTSLLESIRSAPKFGTLLGIVRRLEHLPFSRFAQQHERLGLFDEEIVIFGRQAFEQFLGMLEFGTHEFCNLVGLEVVRRLLAAAKLRNERERGGTQQDCR
jgi:hypothetical protein